MAMYRQGDVLVFSASLDLTHYPKIEALPKGAQKLNPEPGKGRGKRVILAHGEATGHAHALAASLATMYAWDGGRLLEVKPKAVLKHEEHSFIEIAPGLARVIQQKEYHPEEIRQVVD